MNARRKWSRAQFPGSFVAVVVCLCVSVTSTTAPATAAPAQEPLGSTPDVATPTVSPVTSEPAPSAVETPQVTSPAAAPAEAPVPTAPAAVPAVQAPDPASSAPDPGSSASAAPAQAPVLPRRIVKFTAADLATANGSARIGTEAGSFCCVLTSIQARVQLEPDKWDSDAENTNWTTWLTAFDDNLYAKWLKNAPLNAQETVGIRINPDASVNITNNTFLPGPDVNTADAQSTFESAIASSLNETLKMAKPMPVTKNKLKEVHMSLTFMREPRVLPRYGKNDYGFIAVLGDKGATTVYERTSTDGRFPGIQILTGNDDDKVVPLEQSQFDQKVAELEPSN